MFDEASSSAGFGGGVPAGRINNPGKMLERTVACCHVAFPLDKLLRPLFGPLPRDLLMRRRRTLIRLGSSPTSATKKVPVSALACALCYRCPLAGMQDQCRL